MRRGPELKEATSEATVVRFPVTEKEKEDQEILQPRFCVAQVLQVDPGYLLSGFGTEIRQKTTLLPIRSCPLPPSPMTG